MDGCLKKNIVIISSIYYQFQQHYAVTVLGTLHYMISSNNLLVNLATVNALRTHREMILGHVTNNVT